MTQKLPSTEQNESNTSRSLMNRRDYLKGTAATLAAAGGLVGTASAQNYDVIPAQGQTIHIGAGETWENKLIDFSTGNRITIAAHSTNWTIRNIGFQGFNSDAGLYAIFGISDQSGGHSVMENVYMGDGGAAGDGGETGNGHGITAVWANPNHNGHIDIKNCNFQGWYDNALYCSAPGNSGGGTFHIDNCYAANCFVSHYRVATNGSQITNSVVYLDNEFYNGRGVWAWAPGPIPVDNCVFEMNGNHYSFVAGAWNGGSDINVTNTSWDNGFWGGYTTDGGGSVNFQGGNDTNPNAFVPSGVPTSAVEAASGQAGGESLADHPDAQLFYIQGEGEFYLEVDEEVEPHEDLAPYVTFGEEYGTNWVDNELSDNPETNYNEWWFIHDIVELDITEGQVVEIDGEPYDPNGEDELVVIEDFDRSNPLADYGGSTGLFGTTSSPVYEGSQALVNDSGSFGGINSTSGLEEYPSRGDEVHVHFDNAGNENFVSFNLFSQSASDNPDRYSVGISGVDGEWKLWKTEGGSLDTLDSDAPSSYASGWYRAEISTDSTTITADLYDEDTDTLLASISASDSAFSSGGIGFRSAGNGEVWDYVIFPGEEPDPEPEPTIVEDFDRSNPLADYGGSTGLFGTTSSPVYEGSQALVNDSGSFGGVNSTSGLAAYPSRGDEVHVHFDNAGNENFVSFNLFSQSASDNPDRYSVGISGVDGEWKLWKTEGGSLDTLDSDAPSSYASGWYRAEISTDSTTITADLYDDDTDSLLASISASDSTFSSGGIGFRSAGNGEVWDYVIIDE